MGWVEVNEVSSPENKTKSEKQAANRKQAESDLAKSYSRLFKTDDGQKVLADLFGRMVVGNIPVGNEPNINYLSAYKNGESGCVTYIQAQITRAEVI